MSMHLKTITLTEQQDSWVRGQVECGRFGNDGEYIRYLIRRDQQAQERLTTLRKALIEDELSEPKQLDISATKAAGRKRMKAVK
ncbi:type II toxin-antitoxin system ParD family antitoxin [Halomonas sp. ISL-60]|uniref:type II toxin-antitoxin system ParD family antitoxin n=1 Tax=Halomonas sp. ISL-56 TaxID=2819149 RepID=UPI001BEC85DC|nr:type II toxin-antitoxin system ParD family antitoxin [Halomonas sp. ISL-56]MBT2773707.1 type II toxin-antitoxin system ParD family antitoxin [Halomonas sp. ISL-60]MBT2803206.1 type II toxin-antitoxin system ParD family antitoxin [Halomonas sp. ISL-56]